MLKKLYFITALFLMLMAALYLLGGQGTKNKKTGLILISSSQNLIHPDVSSEKKKWSSLIDEVGAKKSYETFKDTYKSVNFQIQHYMAHLMGELIYEKEGLKGLIICDDTFEFGCYHAFFGRAFAEHGLAVIREADTFCRGSGKNKAWIVRCQHGIGHGIMEYLGHDKLVESLNACDLIQQASLLLGCRSGVFMEYNAPIFLSSDRAVFTKVRDFNALNPYDPCPTLPDKFKKTCYYKLSEWWDSIFYYDYQKMESFCGKIENSDYKTYCQFGVGNMVALDSESNIESSLNICEKMLDQDAKINCLAGASLVFFVTLNQMEPIACKTLPLDLKKECIQKRDLIIGS